MQEATLWSAGVGRGSATGGMGVQRKQGLDRSPIGFSKLCGGLWRESECQCGQKALEVLVSMLRGLQEGYHPNFSVFV